MSKYVHVRKRRFTKTHAVFSVVGHSSWSHVTSIVSSLCRQMHGELRVQASEPHAHILEALFGIFTSSFPGRREDALFVIQSDNMPVSMHGVWANKLWETDYISLGLVLTVPRGFPLPQKTLWEFIDHWHLPVVVLIVHYIFWLGWGVIFSFFHPFVLSKSLPFLTITEEV